MNKTALNYLHRLMHNADINEAELARRSGVPQPTTHRILSGNTLDPRPANLGRLASVFGLTWAELEVKSGNTDDTNPLAEPRSRDELAAKAQLFIECKQTTERSAKKLGINCSEEEITEIALALYSTFKQSGKIDQSVVNFLIQEAG